MNKQKGLVYVFTGEGKGKTSAALGVTLRMLLNGKKVCWISWYKQSSWAMSEQKMTEKFEKLEMYFAGEGFYMKDESKIEKMELSGKEIKKAKVNKASVYDMASKKDHESAATGALMLAGSKINTVSLLVLDEVLNAIGDGLVEFEELNKLLKKRKTAHVVLTGRLEDIRVVGIADLVSRIDKVKHPYDVGKLAVRGLDF